MQASDVSEMRLRVRALAEMMELLAQRLAEQRSMVERLSRRAGSRR